MIQTKIKRFFPAVAFFGGFLWDSLTIGRVVSSSDLWFLLIYFLISLFLIFFISRTQIENQSNRFVAKFTDPYWTSRLTWLIQFCFGSLFSALVICYFKSSGSAASFLFVLILLILLVGNEFLQRYYSRFGINLALFCLLGTMFLNFAIPHLFHRLGGFWFLFSTVISLILCFLVWRFSGRSLKYMIAPFAISVFLTIAYFQNWIAPVPLVVKQQEACVQLNPKTFECLIESPSFFTSIGFICPQIHRSPEKKETIYFLSSVFAPAEVQAEIEHRWYYKNPVTGSFEEKDRISSNRMAIRGGRSDGFRIYTKKKNIIPGRWRVETALKGGAVIGKRDFDILEGSIHEENYLLWKLR